MVIRELPICKTVDGLPVENDFCFTTTLDRQRETNDAHQSVPKKSYMLGSSDFEDKTLDVTHVDQPKKRPRGAQQAEGTNFLQRIRFFSQKKQWDRGYNQCQLGIWHKI
jgi:hypothetical protein